ncbi:hypothetical protein [Brucella endophytica]|uniref:hypothetical protein n=1 Tax=Brucella endophytica TaxID=1963359 RepID=UPI0035BC5F80
MPGAINIPLPSEIYYNQIFMITAEVVMAGGSTIPPGAKLFLHSVQGGQAVNSGLPQPVINISSNRTTGSAIFLVKATSYSDLLFTVSPVPSTWTNSTPPTPARVQIDRISFAKLTFVVTPVDNAFLPVAPDSNQLPSNATYTTIASVQVTEDPVGNPNGAKPVGVGFCVQWQNLAKNDLFRSYMRTFLKETDTQPVANDSPLYNSSGYIYTATDNQGIARIYLVSTPTPVTGNLMVEMPITGIRYSAGDFVVAALGTQTDTQPDAPTSDATVGDGGTVDLSKAAGGTVRVQVPSYSGATDTDYIYVLMNKKYQMSFRWSQGMNVTWNGWYNKSDTVNDDETYNILQYIVGTAQGDVYNSIGQAYLVKGPITSGVPSGGQLNPPSIEHTVSEIGWDLVQNPVQVRVTFPYSDKLAAADGDNITAYAVIDAFEEGTNEEMTPTLSGSVSNLPDTNVQAGFVDVPIPGAGFQYLGDQSIPPYTRGGVDFYYTVTRAGLTPGEGTTSEPFHCHLDAIPRGGIGSDEGKK